MANRVVVGAFAGTYVLRGSRPGFDVLNTGLTNNQLAFDSRWDEIGNVLQTGTFTVSGSGTLPLRPLPAGMTSPPIILAQISGSNNNVNEWWPVQSPSYRMGLSLTLSSEQAENGTMLRWYVSFTSDAPFDGTDRICSYAILRNDFG